MARFSDSESSDSESDDNGNFKRRSHRLDDDDDEDDDADGNYYGLPAEPTRMDIVDDDYGGGGGGGGPEPGELSDDNDIVAATATVAASANNHISVSGQLASIDNALASRLKPPPQPQPRDPRLMRASAAVSSSSLSSSLTTNVELARDPRKRSMIVAVVDGDGSAGNIHNKVAADEPLGDDRNDDDINDRTAVAADDKETEEERFAKRLKKFERLDTNTTTTIGGGDIADNYKLSAVSKQPLRERVRKLLNERKPMMAFKEIKDEISITDIPKFKDTFVHIVKDWFPAIVDDALDPRSVFIDTNHVNQFQNLLKDIFGLKVKQKDVWEAVILGIDKFIIESRISSVPLLLTKLRWVLVRDIREYLISEDIRISIKASNVLVDHRIQLQAKREAHRRNFELTNAAGGRQVPVATITPTPAVINNPVPKSSSLFSDMIPLSRPKPSTAAATMNPISITGMPPVVQPTVLSGGCTAASSDYQWSPTKMFDTASASEAMTVMPDDDECDTYGGGSGGGGNNMDGDSKIIVQILNHIKMDQYMRLVHMLIRHTTGSSSSSSKFIEDFGRAIKLFASSYPNHSMYNMFNKLHDLIKVNKSQFTNESALRSAMASLLVEFAEITEFKTKEWILIRDLTINNCGLIPADRNPFNEQIVPIKHNIDCHIPYRLPDTGGRPILKYDDAPDRDIPLISKDHMIDPRVELQCERLIKVDIPEGTPDMPSRSTPQYSTLFSPLQSPINLVSPSASPVRRTKINTKSSNTTTMTITPTKSRARKSFPSPGTKAPLVATNRRTKMPIKAPTTTTTKKKPFAGPPRPSTTAITKSSSIIKTTKAPIRAPTGAKSLAKSQSTPAAAAVTTISNNNNNKIARKTAITDPNRSTTKTAATVVATTTDPVQVVVTKKPIISSTKPPAQPPQPMIVNDPRLIRTKSPITTTGTIRNIGGKYSQQELKSITRKVVLSSSSSDDNEDEDGSS